MKYTVTIAIVLAGIVVISGCISTNVKGYTDRSYSDYHIKKIIVRAPNAGFQFGELVELSMVKEFSERGVPAESFLLMFPPTRDWTNEQVAQDMIREGYDTIMYINLTGSDTSSQVAGYTNSGTATVYSNSVTYSGTSTPVRLVSRSTSTRARIYDVNTGNVIWVGDTSTQAGGLVFMGDETQADSISGELSKALAESGHI